MLHKIGINKCSKDDLKYFSVYNSTEMLMLPSSYKSINNIISFMLSYRILNIDILNFLNVPNKKPSFFDKCLVNLSIEVTYKILYSSLESKQIQGFNHVGYYMLQIKIPTFIDGLSSAHLLNLSKLKGEIFIEDVDIQVKDKTTLLITPYIIGNVLTFPDYSLGYILEMDNRENNVFVSFCDGSRLHQKTFTKNINYKNLCYCPYSNEFAYIVSSNHKSDIYIGSTINQRVSKMNLDILLEDIHSLTYISNTEIAFSAWNGEVHNIYKINTRTKETVQLTTSLYMDNYIYPKFSNESKSLFFILKKGDESYICSLNINGFDLRYLSKKRNILNFALDFGGRFLAYFTFNDLGSNKSNNSIFLMDLEELQEEELLFMEDDFKIEKLAFSPLGDVLALNVTTAEKSDIYFYNIDKGYFKNITKNPCGVNISDFSFNFSGDTLFYSSNDRGNYDVYTLNLKNMKKKNLVSSFSSNITLCYKGL